MPILQHEYCRGLTRRDRLGVRLKSAFRGVLPDSWQQQIYSWNCGPASARIALTCRGVYVSQSQLIREIGTDEDGTDYVGLITPVLTRHAKAQHWDYYPKAAAVDLAWQNITLSIDAGFALVVNIVSDPSNVRAPGYPYSTIWHYICVVGYDPAKRTVHVADPAYFSGMSHWDMDITSFVRMITWQGKGYTGRPVASNLLGFSGSDLAEFADGMRQMGAS